jgi:hypothetical protein
MLLSMSGCALDLSEAIPSSLAYLHLDHSDLVVPSVNVTYGVSLSSISRLWCDCPRRTFSLQTGALFLRSSILEGKL